MGTVLVTGGSGFIGSHAILQLLAAGHQVRATVRSLKRQVDLRALLKEAGAEAGDRLVCTVADLGHDEGWAKAVAGCDQVLHVASPFPAGLPRHEDDLILPALDGTLRVLRASRDAGVQRVVLTSSFAAIGYGHGPRTTAFDETNWTNPQGRDVQPYMKSKTLAERAAWDFLDREGGGLELTVINPVGVFGPVLGPALSTSVSVVQRLLDGAMLACPRLYFGVVDVRDVVDLHLRAMTHPAAKGERFLATAGPCFSLLEVAKVLKAGMGPAAQRVPRWELPDWWVRVAALRNPDLRQLLPQLGKQRSASSDKARRLLDWAPRSSQEALLATAESLVLHGLLQDSPRVSAHK